MSRCEYVFQWLEIDTNEPRWRDAARVEAHLERVATAIEAMADEGLPILGVVRCERDEGHPHGHVHMSAPPLVTSGATHCDHWGPDWLTDREACVYCSGTPEWQAAHPDAGRRR